MKKRQLVALALITVFTIAPALLGLTRDRVMENIAQKQKILILKPIHNSKTNCNGEICTKSSHFKIETHGLHQFSIPTMGYFGAQLDSYLKIDGNPIQPISKLSEIRFTWSRFLIKELPSQQNSPIQHTSIEVVCVSPQHTKKIGMDAPFIFIGDKRSIELLDFIYSLYNIHFFLLGALFVISIGAVISLASHGNVNRTWIFRLSLLTALTLTSWSTIFDNLLITFRIPPEVVRIYALVFWAPTVLFFIMNHKYLWTALSTIWCGLLLFGVLSDYGAQSQYIYGTYRWMYLFVTAVVTFYAFRKNHARFAIPYCALMWLDSAALHGLYSVKSGFYSSGFGLFGLFIGATLEPVLALVRHHIFWHHRQILSENLNRLRNANSFDKEKWKNHLNELCRMIAFHANAKKVSLCYLALESPIIITYHSGNLRDIKDGLLPPVFARVIQTGSPLWWTTGDELSQYLPLNTPKRKNLYNTNIAIIVPIKVENDCYGAISLTEFDALEEITSSSDKKSEIEQIVNSFLDVISVQIVRQREKSTSTIERSSAEFIQKLSSLYSISDSKYTTTKATLETISEKLSCASIYFEFDANTERLILVEAANMTENLKNAWATLPFRARATNRISPFAITINEKRSVFIDNIQTMFGILAPQSVDVIKAAQTTAFASLHVGIANKTLGLLTLLDRPGANSLRSNVTAILDSPLRYFAFALEQWNSNAIILQQEKALTRFANSDLIRLIVDNEASNKSILGQVQESVIITIDLRGSTLAARADNNAYLLAEKLSSIYQSASNIADHYGASFDKGNGDGLIITMPVKPNTHSKGIELGLILLTEVEAAAKKLLSITGSIVVIHRGNPFRGIIGHTRRITWDTCGRDINDTYLIEKHSKLHPEVVLAISEVVLQFEAESTRSIIEDFALKTIVISEIETRIWLFDTQGALLLKNALKNTPVSAHELKVA